MIKSNSIRLSDDLHVLFCYLNDNRYLVFFKKQNVNPLFIHLENTISCIKRNNSLTLSTLLKSTKLRLLEFLITRILRNFDTFITRRLLLKGRGFKANILDKRILRLKIGLSHTVFLDIPETIKISIKKKYNKIFCKSLDLLLINNYALIIKQLKKKDIYKGKGILLSTEKLKLKTFKKK